MKTFNKHQSFKGVNGGGSNINRRDFNKPSFGGNSGSNFSRPGGNFNRGNTEMHQATCADCQKICEVPFRPNGKKPVYCKDCFGKNGGQSSSNTQNFPHKSFAPQNNSRENYNNAPKPYSAPANTSSQSHQNGGNIEDVKKQIEVINVKLDRLMNLIATPHVAKTTPVEAMKVGAVVTAVKAKVATKAAPKKAEAKKKVVKKPVSKKK